MAVAQVMQRDIFPADEMAALNIKLVENAIGDKTKRFSFSRLGGGGGFLYRPADILSWFLVPVYRRSSDISDKTKTQIIIPRLEAMIATLSPQATMGHMGDMANDMGDKMSAPPIQIDDLKYLIQRLKGNTDAKMPTFSIFQLHPQAGGMF